MTENNNTNRKSTTKKMRHSVALNMGELVGLVGPRLRELKHLDRFLAMPVPVVLVGGLCTSLAGTIAATKVADGVLSRQTRALDRKVFQVARRARRSDKKPLEPVMTLLSAAGEPWALYPVSVLATVKWLSEERPTDAATLLLGLVGSAGINGVLKRIVHRPRPRWKLPIARSGSSGSSFPSSHATMSLATYGTIAFLLTRRSDGRRRGAKGNEGNKGKEGKGKPQQVASGRKIAARIWAPMLLFCGLIGWSRVYQGVHNPSDVLGGWLAGGTWLLTCTVASTLLPPTDS